MTPLAATPTRIVDGEVIDLIAIERRLTGEAPRPRLTTAEQRWAARQLDAAGISRDVIAKRLNISGATLRKALGEPPVERSLRPCGTKAAYERHIRRGEPVCDACRHANSAQRRRAGMGPRP